MGFKERLKYWPMVSTGLFWVSNASQIIRMVTEQSAAGQSLLGWCIGVVVLSCWLVFYRIRTPNEKWAFVATALSLLANVIVALVICYFRYVVGS